MTTYCILGVLAMELGENVVWISESIRFSRQKSQLIQYNLPPAACWAQHDDLLLWSAPHTAAAPPHAHSLLLFCWCGTPLIL